MSTRKRRSTSKIRRLHEKLDVLTDEVESLRRSNTRLQDEGALIKAGVTESITAALTPAESGGTPDPGAQTFTLEQFTAMLAKAKVDALLKTPDKLPAPKPTKAKVKEETKERLKTGLFQISEDEEGEETLEDDIHDKVIVYLSSMLTQADGIKQLSQGEYNVSRQQADMAGKAATAVARHFSIPATAKLVTQLCKDFKLKTQAVQPSTQLKAIFRAIVSRKLDLTPDELHISVETLL